MSKCFKRTASLVLGGIVAMGALGGFGASSADASLTFDIRATQLNGNAWGGDYGRNFNLNDDVTIVKGSHTFKGGFFFSADHWWGVGQHRPNGDFSFSSLATAIPGDQSNASGNGFASMLLGYPDRVGLETPRAVRARPRSACASGCASEST